MAQSIFSHASREQIIRCLCEAKGVMKKDGFFLATFVLGKDNYTGSEWVYPDRVTYHHRFIMSLMRKQNLDAIRTRWYHPKGQTWYVIFHPENRSNVVSINKKIFSVNQVRPSIRFKRFAQKQKLLNNAFTRNIYRRIK